MECWREIVSGTVNCGRNCYRHACARTLEICVTSMLESEKAEMTLAAPYLGDSSACSMSLELELLKVMVVQECSYFKDPTGAGGMLCSCFSPLGVVLLQSNIIKQKYHEPVLTLPNKSVPCQEKTGEKNFPKMTQKWLQEGVGSDKPTALSKVTALVDGGLPSFDALTGRMLI